MSTTPQITERTAQPYVAIGAEVTMEQLPGLADQLGEVFSWLAERGLAPAGPPFSGTTSSTWNGSSTSKPACQCRQQSRVGKSVTAGVLPAGRYATTVHVGPYDGLTGAVDNLLQWAQAHGLEWDKSPAGDGEHWGCRLEIYLTNPAEQPDPAKWETQLAFRLK
jgi:effector-binding domain-containing protein